MTKRIVIIDTDLSADKLYEALSLAVHEDDTWMLANAKVLDIHVAGQFDICPKTGAMS